MGVLTLTLATFLTNLNSETGKLSQKMEILDIENIIRGVLANNQVCACNFSEVRFNSANPGSVQLSAIYSGCDSSNPPKGVEPLINANSPVGASTTGLMVDSIVLEDITPTPGVQGAFSARLVANLNPASLKMARRSPQAHVQLTADITDPSAARVISCSTAGAASSGLPFAQCITRGYTQNSSDGSSGGCMAGSPGQNCLCESDEQLLSCFTFRTDAGNSTANVGGATVSNGICQPNGTSWTYAFLTCCK